MPISDQTLHVKSFFAASIPEAIEMARQELGVNALLLQSREAPPEARHLGEMEVVFGSCPQPAAPGSASASSATPSVPDDLRKWMEEARGLLNRLAQVPRQTRFQQGIVEQSLLAADVEPDIARDIDEAVRLRAAKHTVRELGSPRAKIDLENPNLAADCSAEIEDRFETQPELDRIVALVGPPGSGKTTALVKLAVTQGLAKGRRVRLISADTQRVGGADQLRAFAGILGVTFHAVDSVVALAHAIEAPSEALLLIDTPGYSAAALSELGSDLANFLATRQDIDTHLVLTASMHPAILRDVAGAYARFRPRKLLFTRLDEASSYASVFCEAVRQAIPLSFFCQGQEIPEDIGPAQKQIVSASLVRQLPLPLQAAA